MKEDDEEGSLTIFRLNLFSKIFCVDLFCDVFNEEDIFYFLLLTLSSVQTNFTLRDATKLKKNQFASQRGTISVNNFTKIYHSR